MRFYCMQIKKVMAHQESDRIFLFDLTDILG